MCVKEMSSFAMVENAFQTTGCAIRSMTAMMELMNLKTLARARNLFRNFGSCTISMNMSYTYFMIIFYFDSENGIFLHISDLVNDNHTTPFASKTKLEYKQMPHRNQMS